MSTDRATKKLIVHQLTDADLLDLAKSTGKIKIEDKLTEVAKFIYAFKIKHGEAKIDAQLVWFTFIQWKPRSEVPKNKFFQDFNKYFKSMKGKYGNYYLLNTASFDTSEENYWKMRKKLRRKNDK